MPGRFETGEVRLRRRITAQDTVVKTQLLGKVRAELKRERVGFRPTQPEVKLPSVQRAVAFAARETGGASLGPR